MRKRCASAVAGLGGERGQRGLTLTLASVVDPTWGIRACPYPSSSISYSCCNALPLEALRLCSPSPDAAAGGIFQANMFSRLEAGHHAADGRG